jgi:hypothetical protein
MMDRETIPKHIEFFPKNKFEKLVQSYWFYYKKGTALRRTSVIIGRNKEESHD